MITSTPRRLSSTPARSPAAPLPRTTASHRCAGREKPRAATNSLGGLSIASRGMATSVSRSNISGGTVVLKGVIRAGIDEAIKTGYTILARSNLLDNGLGVTPFYERHSGWKHWNDPNRTLMTAGAQGEVEVREGRATIVDVARRAGVSKSTVSLVLGGSSLVADSTRERVADAMADLGYIYHRGAATLRGAKSGVIGMVINDLSNPFYVELAIGIEQACQGGAYIPFLDRKS